MNPLVPAGDDIVFTVLSLTVWAVLMALTIWFIVLVFIALILSIRALKKYLAAAPQGPRQ